MTASVSGLRCAVCGTTVDIAAPLSWCCPRASDTDRHHVLHLVREQVPVADRDDVDPLIAFADRLAWRAFAAAHGLTGSEADRLTRGLDAAVQEIDGTGFHQTPLARAATLSAELGLASGGVWVKDETGSVAGSHKARHLATIALHLLAA
jgi:hypothetical protein